VPISLDKTGNINSIFFQMPIMAILIKLLSQNQLKYPIKIDIIPSFVCLHVDSP